MGERLVWIARVLQVCMLGCSPGCNIVLRVSVTSHGSARVFDTHTHTHTRTRTHTHTHTNQQEPQPSSPMKRELFLFLFPDIPSAPNGLAALLHTCVNRFRRILTTFASTIEIKKPKIVCLYFGFGVYGLGPNSQSSSQSRGNAAIRESQENAMLNPLSFPSLSEGFVIRGFRVHIIRSRMPQIASNPSKQPPLVSPHIKHTISHCNISISKRMLT
jgi:hypothetical protein